MIITIQFLNFNSVSHFQNATQNNFLILILNILITILHQIMITDFISTLKSAALCVGGEKATAKSDI